MIKISTSIKASKLKQFQEILGACNGHFSSNPHKKDEQSYYVDYQFENSINYVIFNSRWKRVTQDIIEIKRLTLWQKLLKFILIK